MKTQPRMTVKFMLIAGSIGCLIGAVIPLKDSDETRGRKSAPAPSRSVVRPDVVEIAKKATVESASACATTSPNEFFRGLLKADPQPAREIVETFFSAWIQRDPDSAFRAALRLPSRFEFGPEDLFFVRQLRDLFNRDPLTALRWVSQIEGVIGGGFLMGYEMDPKLFEALDPEAIRSMVNGCPPGGTVLMMANAYASFLASKDVNAAIRWGESLTTDYQSRVLPMLLFQLSEEDPALALNYIKNAPSNIKQYAALFAINSGSSASVIEAMRWLEEEMGVTSYTGINNLMARLYRQDPKAAVAQVMSLGESTQRIEAVRGLAEAACTSGKTEEVVSLIVTLPDALQLEAARAAMLMRMPGDFPAFLKPLNDGSLSGANLEGYIHQLATFLDGTTQWPEHLAKLQTWLQDNPGPGRDRFIREASEVLRDNRELKDKVFEKLPPEELKQILESRR